MAAVDLTDQQRTKLAARFREDPWCGHVAAARAVGVTGKASDIRAALKADSEIVEALAQARADYLANKRLSMSHLLDKLADIVDNDDSSSQLRAVTTAMNLHGVSASEPQRVEVTGADGGPIRTEDDRSASLDELRTVLDAALGSRPAGQPMADA